MIDRAIKVRMMHHKNKWKRAMVKAKDMKRKRYLLGKIEAMWLAMRLLGMRPVLFDIDGNKTDGSRLFVGVNKGQ